MQTSQRLAALVGVLSGFTLASCVAQFWLNAGTSLPAQSGLALSLSLAFLIGGWIQSKGCIGTATRAAGLFVISSWATASSNVFQFANWLVEKSGVELSSSLVLQTMSFTAVGSLTLIVPVVCVLLLNTRVLSSCSISIGMVTGTVLIAARFGIQGTGLAAAGLGLVAFLTTIASIRRVARNAIAQTELISKPTQKTPGRISINVSASINPIEGELAGKWDLQTPLLLLVALAATAVLWPVMQRLVRQLVTDAFMLMALEWAILLLGVAWGIWQAARTTLAPRFSIVFAASWPALCLAAFSLFVRLALWENSTISQVGLLLILRGTLAVIVLMPIAFVSGLLIGACTRNESRGRSELPTFGTSPLRRGVLLASALIVSNATTWFLPSLGIVNLAVGASVILLLVAGLVARWSIATNRTTNPHSVSKTLARHVIERIYQDPAAASVRWSLRLQSSQHILTAALAILAMVLPATVAYRPELAAKVLFDSSVFLAHRNQLPWEQLPVQDDSRADQIVEGDRGTLTVWSARGTQRLIRENGIPKGTLTANPQVTPRYFPDVLTNLLPLIVHEQPRSVLLLGVRGGESLGIAASFPVQRVLCIESDRGVLQLAKTLAAKSRMGSPFDDDRFAVRCCEPCLAIKTTKERFDVIVASPDQPSLPAAAISFTLESLRSAAGCLNDDGLFALRFQNIDLGLSPVCVLAKTMLGAFKNVTAVEIMPGELLFLGTNSDRGFLREGFVDRLQHPHVRQLLASVGWDWSTPLRMSLLDEEAIASLASHPDANLNQAAKSTWPFRLPSDVIRWDNKLQQVKTELAKHEHFLMRFGGEQADTPDVATRLSEWELSRQIIRRHSDEYWAYRKQVKEHLTKSTRNMIQQVGFEKTASGLHPEDDRRLRYFRAIGDVAKTAHPSEIELNRVRQFESPFDPLVSPFLHQEIVQLTDRIEQRDVAAELRHRLAAIYFSIPADRSIRNVADALQFVNSTPEAIPENAERFDQINSLLQMLLQRWTARSEFQPTSSRIALNDIERSITAVETSFATLDKLSADGVVPRFDWPARKQLLDRRLVRPLRTYRSDVLKHYVKNEQTRDAAGSEQIQR